MADFAEIIDPSSIVDDTSETIEQDDQQVDDQEQVDDQQQDDTQSDDDQQSDEQDEAGDEDKSEEKEGDKAKGGKGDDDIDLRKSSKEIRDALNKFRDADPNNKAAAKLLRTALGHDIAYQESFKTPEEARVFKAQVEAIGGLPALTQMQEQIAYSQEIDAQTEAGDPAILETMAKDFPQGFAKLAAPYLDKLLQMDEKAYGKAIQPHLFDNLEKAGVGEVFADLNDAVDKNDTDRIKRHVTSLLNWFRGQKTQAANLRTSSVNPEKEKIDAEWKKINDAKESSFTNEWRQAVGNHGGTVIYKAAAPYFKSLTVPQQKDFVQGVIQEINRRIEGDKVYKDQENALMKAKNRDVSKIVQFKNAKIDSVVNAAVQAVAQLRRLAPGKPGVAGGNKGGNNAGKGGNKPVVGAGSSPQNPVYIKDKPPVADRDTSRRDAVELQIAGKALMKSGPYKGKWVSWRPKAN